MVESNACMGCHNEPLPYPPLNYGSKAFANQDIYDRLEDLEKRVAELEGKREYEFPLDGGLTAS